MKYFWLVAFVMMFMLTSPVNADAWTQWNVGVGISGGSRGIHHGGIRHGGSYHRSVRRHAVHNRAVIRHGGYRNYGYRNYGYRRAPRHIHRQAGRVYYQGSCLPVVVVPSGSGIVYRY